IAITQTLTQLESLYRAEIQKRDAEQKEWKQQHETYTRMQAEALKQWWEDNKAYQNREKRWEEDNARWNRLTLPVTLTRLAFGIAFAALAIAQCIYLFCGR